jgi:hypothetical protein
VLGIDIGCRFFRTLMSPKIDRRPVRRIVYWSAGVPTHQPDEDAPASDPANGTRFGCHRGRRAGGCYLDRVASA